MPTFQRHVESYGAQANHNVAEKGQDEHRRVRVLDDVSQALEAQPHEDEVCDGVHGLGTVVCDIVILIRPCEFASVSLTLHGRDSRGGVYLFTPVQG